MTATNMCSNFGGKWDSPPLCAYYPSENLQSGEEAENGGGTLSL